MDGLGLETEREAFLKLKPDLLKTHKDEYVAVLGGKVVDSDKDGSDLATRIYKKYGFMEIYIDRVSERENPPIHFRTPLSRRR